MKKAILFTALIISSVSYSQNSSDAKIVNTELVQQKNRVSTKNNLIEAEGNTVSSQEGVITIESTLSFEDTYLNLKKSLEAIPGIRIMAELDHQKNATGVGMDLAPTKLIIFGNPALGTPLMQEEQSLGLDLPQKILVWENKNGQVFVSYNDPYFISERHGIENNKEILVKISGALDNLSKNATGN